MARYRQGRLGEEIKKSISGFLINGAKDPALTGRIISITAVDVTRDLSYATVYVSPVCLTDEDREMVYSGVMAGLERAKGAIRGQVSKDVRMRHTPELRFRLDSSQDYGAHIDGILEDLNRGSE